jgi:hypothetical protein
MKFSCERCLYSTNIKCCFEKHKKSKTHIQKENNEFEENYECDDCHKKYKTNMGLWKHKKNCESFKKRIEEEDKERKENEEKKKKDEEEIRKIIFDLYKQNTEIIKDNAELKKDNAEMKNMLIELSKKENITKIENIDNSQTNSNNKIDFNLFLNEKCKNAINMSSLIESIVITMKDIENLGKHGYVQTVTDMVLEKINNYSVYERPIHYFIGDKPNEENEDDDIELNEIIHIKDNDQWSKEDISEHDVLLTNLNTINDVLEEKTKRNERINQEVKSGRRYNKTGKIITNILDTVKIKEDNVKELL